MAEHRARHRTAGFRQWAWWPLVVVATLVLAGCGYSHKELFPDRYQTVAVPIFENRTFYRGLERELTEALVKQIELRTPYKVVPVSQADSVLLGTVTDVEERLLSRRRVGGLPQEVQLVVSVNFEWKDLGTGGGETITDRRGLEAVGRFVPSSPAGQPVEVARRMAVEQMADAIVSAMRADW